MSMSVHTPAWQRLGLKLKFAKEVSNSETSSATGQPASANGLNGASTSPNDTDKHPNKRRRVDSTQLGQSSNNIDVVPVASTGPHGSAQQRSTHTDNTVNGQQPGSISNGVKRKKSVSFSTDLNVESGSVRTVTEVPVKNAAHDKNSQKSKGTKSPKPKQVGTSDSSKNLTYLDTHYQDRKSWKFNKNRDIWILQHALDTESIPSTHNRALAGYVSGLPEKAAARARLIDRCKESLREVEQLELNETTGKMKQDFMKSLEMSGPMQGNTSLQEWLLEVPRAQLLAWSLHLNVTEYDSQIQRPVVKKSKARSSWVEISSSESESDSDSDSTSSESSSDSDSSDSSD